MPEQWIVARASGECAGCARGFVPGDEMVSALYQEQAQLVRRDFCAACWEKGPGAPHATENTEGAEAVGAGPPVSSESSVSSVPSVASPSAGEQISFWRVIVPEPEDDETRKKRRLEAMLNADVLLDIFKEMDDHPDAQRRRFRFVLGLMLVRRKKLKMTSIAKRRMTDGLRDCLVLVTTGRKKKVTFDVADVKMSEEEIISAQDEVGKVLAMGGVEDAVSGEDGEPADAAQPGNAAQPDREARPGDAAQPDNAARPAGDGATPPAAAGAAEAAEPSATGEARGDSREEPDGGAAGEAPSDEDGARPDAGPAPPVERGPSPRRSGFGRAGGSPEDGPAGAGDTD